MSKKKQPAQITKNKAAGKDAKTVAKPTDRLTKSFSTMRHHIDKLDNFSSMVRNKSGLNADRSKLIQMFSEIVDEYGSMVELDGVTDSADLRRAIIEAIQSERTTKRKP